MIYNIRFFKAHKVIILIFLQLLFHRHNNTKTDNTNVHKAYIFYFVSIIYKISYLLLFYSFFRNSIRLIKGSVILTNFSLIFIIFFNRHYSVVSPLPAPTFEFQSVVLPQRQEFLCSDWIIVVSARRERFTAAADVTNDRARVALQQSGLLLHNNLLDIYP